MNVLQTVVRQAPFEAADFSALAVLQPHLVLAFGSAVALKISAPALAQAFPQAVRAGCSTAGEISAQGVQDGGLVVTAVRFDTTRVVQVSSTLDTMADSFAAGRRMATALPVVGLRAILVFAQGVHINGSAMLAGMTDVVGKHLPITGGLAGDGLAFDQTWVLDAQGVSAQRISCVGLYGDALVFSHGSFGGWTPFGPARKVTRSGHNVLYELDGESALAVYRRYLGEHADGLPASGLLFPFAMLGKDHAEVGLIRTILGIDEAAGSLILAGDIDPDGYLKLMHASTDALVEGAQAAALAAKTLGANTGDALALLVSSAGRKLVMGARVDEEVEAAADVLGRGPTVAGFYSYGEISPIGPAGECKLHNQTMTVTYISERS